MSQMLRLYYQDAEDNFGDILSSHVVSHVSGRQAAYCELKYADIVAIGSLAERVMKKRFKRWLLRHGRPLDVWGTGFLMPGGEFSSRFMRVHALRGKLSAGRIRSLSGEVALGDPGLLCSRLFPGTDKKNTSRVVCLPHLHDLEADDWVPALQAALPEQEVVRLALSQDVHQILQEISSASLVVTTAMHPYIAAHSYDTPVIYLESGRNIHPGGDYKIRDYLSALNRDQLNMPAVQDVMKGQCGATQLLEAAQIDRVSPALVRQIQQDLLSAFPAEYIK